MQWFASSTVFINSCLTCAASPIPSSPAHRPLTAVLPALFLAAERQGEGGGGEADQRAQWGGLRWCQRETKLFCDGDGGDGIIGWEKRLLFVRIWIQGEIQDNSNCEALSKFFFVVFTLDDERVPCLVPFVLIWTLIVDNYLLYWDGAFPMPSLLEKRQNSEVA